jgi:hypothetical protein
MRDSEILQNEADEFKKTMDRVGLKWDPAQIAQSANYEQLLPEHQDFCMQRAADKWDGYHHALVSAGESEFADTYFPVGVNGGPAMSRLYQIRNYLQEEKLAPEVAGGNWWDRTKSAVRNIFDLENER